MHFINQNPIIMKKYKLLKSKRSTEIESLINEQAKAGGEVKSFVKDDGVFLCLMEFPSTENPIAINISSDEEGLGE